VQDVVDYIATPEVQEHLVTMGKACGIFLQMAQRWLKRLRLRYMKKETGMYINGHEQEDIVDYRKKFVQHWKEYEKQFVIYDNKGQVVSWPHGFAVPGVRFHLILVTHDELTFYENDHRKTKWVHEKEKAATEKKGKGQSIMASDFLTVEWGWLKDGDKYMDLHEHCVKKSSTSLSEKSRLYSRQERTEMGCFLERTFYRKLTWQLASLRGRPMGLQQGYFCLTIYQVTRNVLLMLCC
jgi:hypothetical protein